MSQSHGAALDALSGLDRLLSGAAPGVLSLAPGRACATRLVEIGEQLLVASVPVEIGTVVSRALVVIVEAQLDGFPGNLFWDFELPAQRLLDAAVAAGDAASALMDRAAVSIAALQHAFGRRGPIQFRYAHDFLYGFDWARWVQKDATTRGDVGPFDPAFVDHMLRRGAELALLIATNDVKYPSLPEGVARNPFAFRRDPEDEERLHRDLAERGLIPVTSWRFDAEPRWDLPYSALREERALALGLARRPE